MSKYELEELLEIIYYLWRKVAEFVEEIGRLGVTAFVLVTSPLWIIPYAIIRKRRGSNAEEHAGRSQ